MESDPFALVEAMTIAGFATGCEHGYLYIRGEYPLAPSAAASTRSSECRRARLPRRRRDGPTAFASTSSSAAAPAPTSAARRPRCSTRSRATAASRATSRRSRSSVGLFGKPTVVNNVETLVNVLDIVRERRRRRSPRSAPSSSTGTKLFCLSGCVERPGLYEVPFGIDAARAARPGRRRAATGGALQAVLLGGAAGAFVGPDELDLAAHLRGHARRRRDARLGRRHGLRRHRRPGADPAADRRRSSATSRAASACPAASAPSARKRRCIASRPTGRAARGRAETRAARRVGAGDARRLDLRPRADRLQRDRVGHHAASRAFEAASGRLT